MLIFAWSDSCKLCLLAHLNILCKALCVKCHFSLSTWESLRKTMSWYWHRTSRCLWHLSGTVLSDTPNHHGFVRLPHCKNLGPSVGAGQRALGQRLAINRFFSSLHLPEMQGDTGGPPTTVKKNKSSPSHPSLSWSLIPPSSLLCFPCYRSPALRESMHKTWVAEGEKKKNPVNPVSLNQCRSKKIRETWVQGCIKSLWILMGMVWQTVLEESRGV